MGCSSSQQQNHVAFENETDLEAWKDAIPISNPELRAVQSELPHKTTPSKMGITFTQRDKIKRYQSERVTYLEKRNYFQKNEEPDSQFQFLNPSSWTIRLPTKRPTFYCAICLENVSVLNRYCLSGEPCMHIFCKECLGAHLAIKVTEGQVRNPCPMVGSDDCGNFATEEDIKSLCSDDIFTKFQRFEKIKSNENHRECPQCNHMQLGKRRRPAMVCEKCNFSYCFFHANAHPEESCRTYARRLRQTELETILEKKKTSKNCPGCDAPTQKNGGCNHMTCWECETHWCWVCGRDMGGVEGVQRHYEWWNLCGCAGAHFRPIDFPAAYLVLTKCFFVLIWVLGIVICTSFCLITILLYPLTLGCFVCWKKCKKHELGKTSGKLFEDIAFFPALFAGGVVVVLISLFLAAVLSFLLAVGVCLFYPIIYCWRKSTFTGTAPTGEEIQKLLRLPFVVLANFFDSNDQNNQN